MVKYNKKGCKVEYRKIRNSYGKSLKIMIVRPEEYNGGKLPGYYGCMVEDIYLVSRKWCLCQGQQTLL
jgi:hypothetical protein